MEEELFFFFFWGIPESRMQKENRNFTDSEWTYDLNEEENAGEGFCICSCETLSYLLLLERSVLPIEWEAELKENEEGTELKAICRFLCYVETLVEVFQLKIIKQLPFFESIRFGVEFIVNWLLHLELGTVPGRDWKLSLLQDDLEAYKWNSKDFKFKFKNTVVKTFPNISSCSMISWNALCSIHLQTQVLWTS